MSEKQICAIYVSDFAPISKKKRFLPLSEMVTKKEITPEKFAEFLDEVRVKQNKSDRLISCAFSAPNFARQNNPQKKFISNDTISRIFSLISDKHGKKTYRLVDNRKEDLIYDFRK